MENNKEQQVFIFMPELWYYKVSMLYTYMYMSTMLYIYF